MIVSVRAPVFIVFILLTVSPVLGDCPDLDPAATKSQTAPLFQRLQTSPSETEGMELASRIWSLWATAPDAHAQALLDKGMQSIQWGALDEAETALSYLTAYCPEYAEGWNQRAFARYLKRDFEGALADLDRTLALEPRHFGALAGRGLTFLSQGRQLLGQQALREAVKLHPWINERHLLPPEEKT